MTILGGEFDPGGVSRSMARNIFLSAVERLAPEVLEDLEKKVLPLVPEQYTNYPFYLCVPPEQWSDLEALRKFSPEYYPAGEALHKWANRHGLNAPWLLEGVGIDLGEMKKCGAAWLTEDSSEAYWDMPDEPIIWNPAVETRAKHEERHKEYLVRREAAAYKMGWQPSTEKRKLIHFDWLVRYQVHGWRMRQIKKNYCYHHTPDKKLKEESILKVVRQVAEFIELEIRNPKN